MVVCLGGKPTLLLSTMDGQLEPVRQDIRNVQERIVKYEEKLAAAERAGNMEEEKPLLDLLRGLQEEKNILLRSQAPSKPCFVHTGLPVFTSFCAPFSEKKVQACIVGGFIYWCVQLHHLKTL